MIETPHLSLNFQTVHCLLHNAFILLYSGFVFSVLLNSAKKVEQLELLFNVYFENCNEDNFHKSCVFMVYNDLKGIWITFQHRQITRFLEPCENLLDRVDSLQNLKENFCFGLSDFELGQRILMWKPVMFHKRLPSLESLPVDTDLTCKCSLSSCCLPTDRRLLPDKLHRACSRRSQRSGMITCIVGKMT